MENWRLKPGTLSKEKKMVLQTVKRRVPPSPSAAFLKHVGALTRGQSSAACVPARFSTQALLNIGAKQRRTSPRDKFERGRFGVHAPTHLRSES